MAFNFSVIPICWLLTVDSEMAEGVLVFFKTSCGSGKVHCETGECQSKFHSTKPISYSFFYQNYLSVYMFIFIPLRLTFWYIYIYVYMYSKYYPGVLSFRKRTTSDHPKKMIAPRLTNHLSDCSVSSRVVVMVQWLAHLTCNPGNAGSIPTHGLCVFSFKMDHSVFRTGS